MALANMLKKMGGFGTPRTPSPITGNAQQLDSQAPGVQTQANGVPDSAPGNMGSGVQWPVQGSSLPNDDWMNHPAVQEIMRAMQQNQAPKPASLDSLNAPYGSNMRYSSS